MNTQCTRLLLEGEYICDVRYPTEYEVLQDPAEQERVDSWLAGLNMRLARLGGGWGVLHGASCGDRP